MYGYVGRAWCTLSAQKCFPFLVTICTSHFPSNSELKSPCLLPHGMHPDLVLTSHPMASYCQVGPHCTCISPIFWGSQISSCRFPHCCYFPSNFLSPLNSQSPPLSPGAPRLTPFPAFPLWMVEGTAITHIRFWRDGPVGVGVGSEELVSCRKKYFHSIISFISCIFTEHLFWSNHCSRTQRYNNEQK